MCVLALLCLSVPFPAKAAISLQDRCEKNTIRWQRATTWFVKLCCAAFDTVCNFLGLVESGFSVLLWRSIRALQLLGFDASARVRCDPAREGGVIPPGVHASQIRISIVLLHGKCSTWLFFLIVLIIVASWLLGTAKRDFSEAFCKCGRLCPEALIWAFLEFA